MFRRRLLTALAACLGLGASYGAVVAAAPAAAGSAEFVPGDLSSTSAANLEIPAMVRGYWERNAPTCDGYPAKDNCEDGDMVLFGAMLCASGESRGCDLVRASQSADGEWWRSPRRNPGNLGESPSFSRDMASGVLLYLVTTHDTAAARNWLAWIEGNRPCLTRKWDGGCLIRGPHRFCRDETNQVCTLSPGNWALLARVWHALGLPLSPDMQHNRDVDRDLLPVEAATVEVGYGLHLTAVETLLKQRLRATPEASQRTAEILVQRQPDNPFYVFLRDGATPMLRDRLLALCPSPTGSLWTSHHQWSWERGTDSHAWDQSMGWDCLFLANLLKNRGLSNENVADET